MSIPKTIMSAAAILPALLGMAPQDRGAHSPAEFWIFFSPRDGDFTKTLSEFQALAKGSPAVRLRPVFLVDESALLKNPTEALGQNVKGLRALIGSEFALRVWDADGLAVARALGIERLPAVVRLERDAAGARRKAHLAYGLGVDLTELCRCEK